MYIKLCLVHSGDRTLYFDTLKGVEVFFVIQYHYGTESGTFLGDKVPEF